MEYRKLSTDLDPVSAISLGSWNTYSRIPFDDLCSLLSAAITGGINYFDVGYYWDNPHTEVLFGHAMRVLGVDRDAYLIAQKLWLWDYPDESFEDQVTRSLTRLGTDRVDVVMVSGPTHGVDLAEYLEEVGALITRGFARAWGATNWDLQLLDEAYPVIERLGLQPPIALQLQYSIARRNAVEDPAYTRIFERHGLSLQPADSLEGGIIVGKLDRDRLNPDDDESPEFRRVRNIARDAGGIRPAIRHLYPEVAAAARSVDATPAQFALAYVLNHPHRSTVLVGASSATQVKENLQALTIARDRGAEIAAAVARLDFGATGHPKLFSPSVPNSR